MSLSQWDRNDEAAADDEFAPVEETAFERRRAVMEGYGSIFEMRRAERAALDYQFEGDAA